MVHDACGDVLASARAVAPRRTGEVTVSATECEGVSGAVVAAFVVEGGLAGLVCTSAETVATGVAVVAGVGAAEAAAVRVGAGDGDTGGGVVARATFALLALSVVEPHATSTRHAMSATLTDMPDGGVMARRGSAAAEVRDTCALARPVTGPSLPRSPMARLEECATRPRRRDGPLSTDRSQRRWARLRHVHRVGRLFGLGPPPPYRLAAPILCDRRVHGLDGFSRRVHQRCDRLSVCGSRPAYASGDASVEAIRRAERCRSTTGDEQPEAAEMVYITRPTALPMADLRLTQQDIVHGREGRTASSTSFSPRGRRAGS